MAPSTMIWRWKSYAQAPGMLSSDPQALPLMNLYWYVAAVSEEKLYDHVPSMLSVIGVAAGSQPWKLPAT
ncbi:MAG: hypothetical protein ACPH1A_07720 [Flavobacteriales bacterium]